MYWTKEELIALTKVAGQEMIDRAEDFVGNDGNYISDFTIWVRIPVGQTPTIEVQREHVIKNSFQIGGRS